MCEGGGGEGERRREGERGRERVREGGRGRRSARLDLPSYTSQDQDRAVLRRAPLQGYLAHKKPPPPDDHRRTLEIGLL